VPAKTFEDLVVWQRAHAFVLLVYRLTEDFPRHELFGLTSQLRRAAMSIAANIAEGFRRHGPADKGRFLNIAQGSVEECRYYLLLCRDLRYGDVSEAQGGLEETSRLLERYTTAVLRNRRPAPVGGAPSVDTGAPRAPAGDRECPTVLPARSALCPGP
jgi:four helix bundle protein